MKKRVLLLYDPGENVIALLKKKLPKNIELVIPKTFKTDELKELIKEADFAIGARLKEEMLDIAHNLKVVQVPWVGVEWLPLKSIQEKRPDLIVCNTHANAGTIAEHAIALLFSAAKKIVIADRNMRHGEWGSLANPLISERVEGKNMLFLGFGHVAQKIAAFLWGFNLKYYVVKRHPEKLDPQWAEKILYIGGRDALSEFLEKADFIMIALPLTPETKGMIGKPEFEQMKETAILVNVGRGPVVDEEALFEALLYNKIQAAALDVWYQYPPWRRDRPRLGYPSQYPFSALDNIVMSPHRAYQIRDAVEVHWHDVLENLQRFSEGKPLINIVDIKRGY